MDYNVYSSNISDTFITSWNVAYPSEGMYQEYFCQMDSYHSGGNTSNTFYSSNWNAVHPPELQPERNGQLDPFCQEFNFVRGHSTATSEAQFDSQYVPESGNTSDTSCSPTLSQCSGDLLASAVSEIGDFAAEIEVTAGPVADAAPPTALIPAGVPINPEQFGFQVHIQRGENIKAPPFSVIKKSNF
jgi:hypothetical protein